MSFPVTPPFLHGASPLDMFDDRGCKLKACVQPLMSQHQGPLAHSRGIPEDIVRLGSLQITSSWDHSTSNDHFLRIKPNPPHTPCYLRSSRFKNGERTGSGWSKLGKLWVYPILAHFAGFDIPAISCQWSIAKLCKTAGLSAIWSNSMPLFINPDQLINPFFFG